MSTYRLVRLARQAPESVGLFPCGERGSVRIVSQNSEQDLKRHRAEEEFALALRKLAANLMRVTRGAGKPHDIGHQVQAVGEAIDGYREAAGHFPWADDAASHLDIWERPEDREKLGNSEYARRHIEDLLVRACLQLVASRLLRQPMQEGTAERDLYFAIDQMREFESERQKRRAAAEKADRTPQKKGKSPHQTSEWDD